METVPVDKKSLQVPSPSQLLVCERKKMKQLLQALVKDETIRNKVKTYVRYQLIQILLQNSRMKLDSVPAAKFLTEKLPKDQSKTAMPKPTDAEEDRAPKDVQLLHATFSLLLNCLQTYNLYYTQCIFTAESGILQYTPMDAKQILDTFYIQGVVLKEDTSHPKSWVEHILQLCSRLTQAPHDSNRCRSSATASSIPYYYETSNKHTTQTPQTDVTQTPQTDVTHTPQTDVTQTPQTDVTQTPQTDVTHTPQTDVTQTPQTDVTHTPQTDVTQTPQTDVTQTPQTDVTHTPQTDVTQTLRKYASADTHQHQLKQSDTSVHPMLFHGLQASRNRPIESQHSMATYTESIEKYLRVAVEDTVPLKASMATKTTHIQHARQIYRVLLETVQKVKKQLLDCQAFIAWHHQTIQKWVEQGAMTENKTVKEAPDLQNQTLLRRYKYSRNRFASSKMPETHLRKQTDSSKRRVLGHYQVRSEHFGAAAGDTFSSPHYLWSAPCATHSQSRRGKERCTKQTVPNILPYGLEICTPSDIVAKHKVLYSPKSHLRRCKQRDTPALGCRRAVKRHWHLQPNFRKIYRQQQCFPTFRWGTKMRPKSKTQSVTSTTFTQTETTSTYSTTLEDSSSSRSSSVVPTEEEESSHTHTTISRSLTYNTASVSSRPTQAPAAYWKHHVLQQDPSLETFETLAKQPSVRLVRVIRKNFKGCCPIYNSIRDYKDTYETPTTPCTKTLHGGQRAYLRFRPKDATYEKVEPFRLFPLKPRKHHVAHQTTGSTSTHTNGLNNLAVHPTAHSASSSLCLENSLQNDSSSKTDDRMQPLLVRHLSSCTQKPQRVGGKIHDAQIRIHTDRDGNACHSKGHLKKAAICNDCPSSKRNPDPTVVTLRKCCGDATEAPTQRLVTASLPSVERVKSHNSNLPTDEPVRQVEWLPHTYRKER